MTKAKRSYKDGVFRSFFREKENFLSLAAAVTGEVFDPDEARENTVENVLFNYGTALGGGLFHGELEVE